MTPILKSVRDRIPTLNRRTTPILAMALGVGAAVGLIAWTTYQRSLRRNGHRRVEAARDKTLKDSFPASDPPASQYFDIPVNRL